MRPYYRCDERQSHNANSQINVQYQFSNGPNKINSVGHDFIKILKNVSCEYDFERDPHLLAREAIALPRV